nr:unnamed protein product [Callosobruchus analis]
MDRPARRNHRNREKKPPRVPIKTYRWEEVRRSRRRGGYPWTHLYKQPFSEDLDVAPYTMEGLKRGKSTSTVGDRSYLTISEMTTESEREGSVERIDTTLQIVSEPEDEPEESGAASAANSVLIEECDGKGDEKEKERMPPKKENVENMEVPDDPSKRKRKISAESNYSKISQTKSAIIRKLKETKDKIKVPKVPKISLPISKVKRPTAKKSKNSPPTIKKETQKSTIPSPSKTNQTPVYIHIPLKPPPGEIDEFSHLEFESKEAAKKEEKKAGGFKALLKNLKQLQELEAKEDAKKGVDFKEEQSKDLTGDGEKTKAVLDKELLKEIEITEVKSTPVIREVVIIPTDEEKAKKDDDTKEETETTMEKVEIIEEQDKENVVLETEETKEAAEEDIFDDLFRKSSFKKEAPSTSRMVRSKSVEPEKKRKLSLESSYSRKSLSRLGIMKRLKDTSEKIKSTFSRSGSKKKPKPTETSTKVPAKKAKDLKPQKPVDPVYIHIPLRPQEGEKDDASQDTKKEEVKESETPETPDSLQSPEEPSGNVQLIILTAPSDDEVLDYNSSDVPETPSSETKSFFESKTELAKLAKDAADTVKKLEPVKEENGSEKSLEDEDKTKEKANRKEDIGEKVVDVEDGLSETKIIKAESLSQLPIPPEVPAAEITAATEAELKSSIKGGFGSPVMKKKVSFKRRSKSSKDSSYEDVQAPVEKEKKEDSGNGKDKDNVEKIATLGPSQSMSVDEEKAYLEDKIVKHSSLEEDYSKWSKNIILPLGEVPMDNNGQEPLRKSASPDRQPTFVKFAPTEEVVAYHDEPPPKPTPGRFQQAFREKTETFKNKLHNMKRPHIKKPNIHLPDRPKFNKPNLQRFKIDKSKFHMPKIPDTAKINLPSFSLPRRQSGGKPPPHPPLQERNLSTEAQDGDAKAAKPSTATPFDFGTFPKMLKKIGRRRSRDTSDFGTAPRSKKSETTSTQESSRWSGSESVGGPQESSHARYEHDIGNEDEFERENGEGEFNGGEEGRDFHDRWQHGRFNVEDEREGEFEGRGVLEEINSDEFLWRQKGISQEDVDVRRYLTSEIKEAFRTPQNALTQLDDARTHGLHLHRYDLRGSNQSLPETTATGGGGGNRKPARKPKRKKTPHASQEKIHQTQYPPEDSASEDIDDVSVSPPSRPRRRSKRTRKPKSGEDIVPYQETIMGAEGDVDIFGHRESLGGILGDDEDGDDDVIMYGNERMAGKEQPEIAVADPYKNLDFERELPAAPPRKHKSLKSLTVSENGSLFGAEPEIEVIKTDSKLIIPIEPKMEAPSRPSRSRSRANSQSQSRGTSIRDDESLSRHRSYSATVAGEPQCVEEPVCVKQVCDYMGYSVVDKNKVREPPLPPPRAPRKKRSAPVLEEKFFTVPRTKSGDTPVRPLRNYSTLVQAKKAIDPISTEDKENVDVIQYVEIDDDEEPVKDDVIKKIQDRPLPAPPRPPRKSRQETEPLRDITSLENIASGSIQDLDKPLDEAHTATQTEPLPDDFVCEEVTQEPSDTVITPTEEKPIVERRLITPTVYSYEETVTHGSLLVEPLNGAQILPESQLSRERLVPVTKDSDCDETSSIPEEFTRLNDPPKQQPSEFDLVKTHKLQVGDLDVDTLTVNKLLADRIVVSEIDSSSIHTNEISSNTGALKVGEITLPPGVIESIMKTMQSSQPSKEDPGQKKTSISERIDGASPTPRDAPIPSNSEEPPSPPPRYLELENTVEEIRSHQASTTERQDSMAPPRPPRQGERPRMATSSSQEREEEEEGSKEALERPVGMSTEQILSQRLLEPDVDDEAPPPRPPQPSVEYIPSQPPASFYALRAQKFVESHEGNIPRRLQRRASEPSLSQLSGQLARACVFTANHEIKRFVGYLLRNVLANDDGKQDLNVMIIITLVLIAGLILLGYGEEKTVVHLHHWEYFNPPRDL